MSNLTRRAILRGSSIAAAAAAVTAIPAIVQAAIPSDPDATLLQLEAERIATKKLLTISDAALTRAFSKLPGWAHCGVPMRDEHLPQDLFNCPSWRLTYGRPLTLEAIIEKNKMEAAATYPATHWKWLDQWEDVKEIGRQRIAWWHKRVASIKAERDRAGIAAADAQFETLVRRLMDIDEAIRDTPAHGLAGIAVKLRLARTCMLESHEEEAVNDDRDVADIPDSWEGRIAISALADVERLAGKGGAA